MCLSLLIRVDNATDSNWLFAYIYIMKYLLLVVFFSLVVFAFSSCEKEVHINLGTSPTQLVVQGAVETGVPPYVAITSTIGFFSTIDLTTLENSFIHDVDIEVSDGSRTIKLREYAIDTGTQNKFYFYSVDTSNFSNIMLGETGKYYSLKITYNGKTYTSITKIPYPKGPDSLWFAEPTFKNSKTPDSAVILYANYSDPDTPGNYVRYFTSVDGAQYFPAGIFSDEVVNGKVVKNIDLYAGYDNSSNANGDSLRYFYPGGTVRLKWCEIDKKVFNFYNSSEYAANSIGNPFASPINLQTNITNGALGVWAGYGSVIKTLIVPR